MKAIVMTEHGGPEVLQVQELPDPTADDGEVLVRVKAFGLNHADTYMRSGIWPFGIPVLGIEAAGTVEADPSGRLARGDRVVAIVGGMARTRNGSYAELVAVPATNVIPIDPNSAGQNWRQFLRSTPPRGPRFTPTWRCHAASRC